MKFEHTTRTDSRLGVKFVITSMPVGGAETLLMNLIRAMDPLAFAPSVVCLKGAGVLGQELAREFPVDSNLLATKWDVAVLPRLIRLFRKTPTDAVITVGAGDKMFWGRLAAKLAGVPVICSALHSTGWPDGVGLMNRWLTPITDGFIAVARAHAEHLSHTEGFPASRVFMVPNGIDTNRFRPNHTCRSSLRNELGIPQSAQVVTIVAALRAEKNHQQFIDAAQVVLRQHAETHFVIVGEGPMRSEIEQRIGQCGVAARVHLLGNRSDTERILAASDLFCLTSRNEANPVSILEALSCGVPVVAPDVGSIHETVVPGQTGLLTEPLSVAATADALMQLLASDRRAKMGAAGRELVREAWSLEAMVQGYETLIETIFNAKAQANEQPLWQRPRPAESQAAECQAAECRAAAQPALAR